MPFDKCMNWFLRCRYRLAAAHEARCALRMIGAKTASLRRAGLNLYRAVPGLSTSIYLAVRCRAVICCAVPAYVRVFNSYVGELVLSTRTSQHAHFTYLEWLPYSIVAVEYVCMYVRPSALPEKRAATAVYPGFLAMVSRTVICPLKSGNGSQCGGRWQRHVRHGTRPNWTDAGWKSWSLRPGHGMRALLRRHSSAETAVVSSSCGFRVTPPYSAILRFPCISKTRGRVFVAVPSYSPPARAAKGSYD